MYLKTVAQVTHGWGHFHCVTGEIPWTPLDLTSIFSIVVQVYHSITNITSLETQGAGGMRLLMESRTLVPRGVNWTEISMVPGVQPSLLGSGRDLGRTPVITGSNFPKGIRDCNLMKNSETLEPSQEIRILGLSRKASSWPCIVNMAVPIPLSDSMRFGWGAGKGSFSLLTRILAQWTEVNMTPTGIIYPQALLGGSGKCYVYHNNLQNTLLFYMTQQFTRDCFPHPINPNQ